MKKNLFAAFLAVALVIALVFVVAPNSKAETAIDFKFTAEDTSYTVAGDCVIDLNGIAATITVAEGLETIPNVVVIDSKNLEDMTGAAAGTLTVIGDCNINDVNLINDFRYLKVDNGDTYSFYPFNMAITTAGVHVKGNAISLEVRFVANKVVQDKLTGYGLYKHDGENAQLFANVEPDYKFEDGKYGLRVCFDLTGSLATDMLNETRIFSAYVEIDGTPIIGNQRVAVTPADILNLVNEGYEASSDEQKTLAKVLFWKNPSLRAKLGNITDALATISVPAEYNVPFEGITLEEAKTCNGVLDEFVSISTYDCTIGGPSETNKGMKGQINLQANTVAASKPAYLTIKSTYDISKIVTALGRLNSSGEPHGVTYNYTFEFITESGSTTQTVTVAGYQENIEITNIPAGCKTIKITHDQSAWGGVYGFTLYREEEGLNCTGHIDKNGEEGGYVCDFCEQPFVPAPPVPDPRTYSNFTGFAANSDDIVTLSKIGNAYASDGKFILNAGEGLSIESTYNISKMVATLGRLTNSGGVYGKTYNYTIEFITESGSTTQIVTVEGYQENIEITNIPAGCKAIKITHDQSVWGGVYSFTLTFSN